MKKFINIVLVLVVCFLLAGCDIDNPNVIGIQTTKDGISHAELKLINFPLESDAKKYYNEKKIETYFLFIRTSGGYSDEWFKEFKGLSGPDGSKIIQFTADETASANEKSIEFLKEFNKQFEKI